jgi:predicted ATPase
MGSSKSVEVAQMEMVGREDELQELLARLSTRRLVTVTGAGGIGKTTLAKAAVVRAAPNFALGSRTVDLTVVDSSDQVSGSVAAQLGFATFDALISSTTEQPVLLLVDNCEHVAEPAAAVIAALLNSCEAPSILATSRSPLGIPGESLVVVGPLPIPQTDDAETAAVRLLYERAADAGATLTEDQRGAAAQLCREVDGVPLALEVAAARLRTMTAEEIISRLHDGADVLTRVGFRGPPRHRSVMDTIQWSYDLLAPDVAVGFERLGVVTGPFSAAMAHAITATEGEDATQTDALLQILVDASLLVAEPRGPVTWYRLLESVRIFAQKRLSERGSIDATQDLFADHVVVSVSQLIEASRGGWSGQHLHELLTSFDNIAAALRWSIKHDKRPQRSTMLASALWGLVHQAHVDDIAALTEATLDRWPDPELPGYVDVAATMATAAFLLGDTERAGELARTMLPYASTASYALVTLPRVLAHLAHARGETDEAATLFEQAVRSARAQGLLGLAMESEVLRASLLADAGRGKEALAALARVREEARTVGADINEIWALTIDGYVRLRVDPESAPAVINAALAASRRAGYPAAIVAGLRSSVLAQVSRGALGDAARTLLSLLNEPTMMAALSSQIRMVLDACAVVLQRIGRPSWSDVAATARAAPVVSVLLSIGNELCPLPTVPGQVLPVRTAIAAVRRELNAVLGTGLERRETPGEEAPAVFADRGELWEIQYAGRTVHLKGSRGIEDLARLLRFPGREVHCLELMGALVEEPSTGDVIDAVAQRAFEQRIRDLQADIDDAETDHDYGRAERAREELDTRVDHLTASLGLGGRSRRTAGSAERARSAATQRIRSAMKRLAALHPELGRHLDASITTGTFCSYQPEHVVVWQS